MERKFKRDLSGRKNEMLEIVSFSHTRNGYEYWVCKCSCGNTKTVLVNNVLYGKTRSCGCLQRQIAKNVSKTHGQSQTRLYGIWKGMKNRCYNPNVSSFENYGGRGIRLCDEWLDFEVFASWAHSNGYEENLTIERKDCNGMYEPGNCEWIPLPDQGKNTRKNRYIEYEGKKMSLAEWSRFLGGGPNLVTTRLQRGWSVEDAVTTPPGKPQGTK